MSEYFINYYPSDGSLERGQYFLFSSRAGQFKATGDYFLSEDSDNRYYIHASSDGSSNYYIYEHTRTQPIQYSLYTDADYFMEVGTLQWFYPPAERQGKYFLPGGARFSNAGLPYRRQASEDEIKWDSIVRGKTHHCRRLFGLLS